MANIKYFADRDGQTFEFKNVDHRSSKGDQSGTWGWCAERSEWIKVTRRVQYKAFPSKHECDARCMNATGRTMNCECSCGGKNHGKGSFSCAAV
jgi:hypothetical protein